MKSAKQVKDFISDISFKLEKAARGGAHMCIFLAGIVTLPLTFPLKKHKSARPDSISGFSSSAIYSDKQGCERVRYIDDNTEALIWRLRLFAAAKSEIIYSTMDFRADSSGRKVLAALLNAAERGVKVKLIADAVYSDKFFHSPELCALASHPNVAVKRYNPIYLLRPWQAQMRLHDKYVIIDGSIYMLGGRNTNDLFLGSTCGKPNIDRELLVYSPSGAPSSLSQLMAYFEHIWALPQCRKKKIFRPRRYAGTLRRLNALYSSLRSGHPDAFSVPELFPLTLPTRRITLLANSDFPENKEPVLWQKLNDIMLSGQNIIIQTPYIIMSRQMYNSLALLCGEGRSVGIITNSVRTGANLFGGADYLNQKKKLKSAGFDLYEYSGRDSCHLKSILVDDRISITGSFNFDMRSCYLDTELMLAVDSEELNASLRQRTQKFMDASLLIGTGGESSRGAKYSDGPFSPVKKVLCEILRVLILPIRYLL